MDEAIAKTYQQIAAMNAELEPLAEHSETFELLSTVTPIHLFNPSFQGKARDDASSMKVTYVGLAEDCDLLVGQLRRDKMILERYLNSLPVVSMETRIQKLKKKIKDELEELNYNLKIYEVAQKKLADILMAIEDAIVGKKVYNYNGEGIKRGTCKIQDLPPLPGSKDDVVSAEATLTKSESDSASLDDDGVVSAEALVSPLADGGAGIKRSKSKPAKIKKKEAEPASMPTTVTIAPSGPLGFLLEDKPKYGWMNYFDVTHKPIGGVESFGRFTEQHTHLNSPADIYPGEERKGPQGRFVVAQFPKAVDPAMTDADLTAAKVNFSMAMAAQILANLEGPPTEKHPLTFNGSSKEKEEEMAYLWTALMILGEVTPFMKFKSEGIRIDSGTFRPESQQGAYWGYSSTSLHETVFKEARFGEAIKLIKEDLAAVTRQKFERPDDAKMASVTATMRNRLMGIRDKAEEAIKVDGVLPLESSASLTST